MNYGYPVRVDNPDTLKDPFCFAKSLYDYVAGAEDFSGLHVAEIGSGNGGGAAYLSESRNALEYRALDISMKNVSFARRIHIESRAIFLHGDAQKLPFQDGSLDRLISVESVHCYGNKARFFAEASRVLKPNGRLMFASEFPGSFESEASRLMSTNGFIKVDLTDITHQVNEALPLHTRNLLSLGERLAQDTLPLYEKLVSSRGIRSGWRYLRFEASRGS
jgi:ubiquinone/menaquinone biosynthesis C-methylase UbiE